MTGIPQKSFAGQSFDLTMTEFRANPGAAIDCVRLGATVHLLKLGKHVASIVPSDESMIVVNSDGSTRHGRKPITFRRPELLRD